VGGTPIESWIAADVQRHSKSLQPFFEEQSPAANAPPTESETKKYEQDLAKWAEAAKKARAENQKLPRKPTDPKEVRNRKGNVGGLFNGKIAPLIPYTMRGALWYQGEANSFPAKAPFYEHQLPLLIQDWRSRWGYDFPFAWAQLPNFEGEGRDWPTIREAMLKSLSIPKTGMGINIDIGDKKDIHPKNKPIKNTAIDHKIYQFLPAPLPEVKSKTALPNLSFVFGLIHIVDERDDADTKSSQLGDGFLIDLKYKP
jgi:sialate O-acetylesterase